MNKEQARQATIDACQKEIQKIIAEIKEAASKGDLCYRAYCALSVGTLCWLSDNGYAVKYTETTRYEKFYTISWE
jgi:hypothetical protein